MLIVEHTRWGWEWQRSQRQRKAVFSAQGHSLGPAGGQRTRSAGGTGLAGSHALRAAAAASADAVHSARGRGPL